MLRSIFVIAIILVGVRYSLKGPFYALLVYLWIAYFRPESWLWSDFFTQLNLSFIVGIVILGATLLSGRQLRFGGGALLLLLVAVQSLFSTLMSPVFEYSWPFCQDFLKTTVISFLIVTLVDTEWRLRMTMAVIGLSLGAEATKQGWAQL